MHFIIPRQELVDLLRFAQDIVAMKTPVPLLSNFKIEAKDSRLILTATDLTVGVLCTGSAKIIKEGSTTLPARRFSQLVRELTCSQVEVETGENHVTELKAGTSTFRIHGLKGYEFPDLPDFEDAQSFTFKQKELKDALRKTSFAVSKEDSRYVLTGVFLELSEKSCVLVGTDGKRLARFCMPIDKEVSEPLECIIPIKAVDECIKALSSDDEATCTLYVMEDKVALEANDAFIATKLLKGEYPDVDRVIPEQSNSVVQLHRDELMALLRQVVLFTTEDHYSVCFGFKEGELTLRAMTSQIGEGKVSMPVNYSGPNFEMAFNPHSFLDVLRHSENETVSLGFTDPYNPGIIVDGDLGVKHQELPNQLFVLMPLRVLEESTV